MGGRRARARVHGEHGRDVGDLDGSSRRYQMGAPRLSVRSSRTTSPLSPDLEHYLGEQRRRSPRRGSRRSTTASTRRAFARRRRQARPLPGCPFAARDHWLVGTVGRMETVKDQINLARAFVRALRAASRGAATDAARPDRRRPAAAAGGGDPGGSRRARSGVAARRARRRARDAAGPRLLRAAVARRGHLEHDPRGDGHGAAGRRDAGRRQRRAGRGRHHRPARAGGGQRSAGPGDGRVFATIRRRATQHGRAGAATRRSADSASTGWSTTITVSTASSSAGAPSLFRARTRHRRGRRTSS